MKIRYIKVLNFSNYRLNYFFTTSRNRCGEEYSKMETALLELIKLYRILHSRSETDGVERSLKEFDFGKKKVTIFKENKESRRIMKIARKNFKQR